MRMYLVALASMVAGCVSFDSSGVDLERPVNPALIERTLQVRYFIDEADSGQEPIELIDSSTNPLPLAIEYVGDSPAFVETDGHRGLQWSQSGSDARVNAAIDSNAPLFQALHGGTTATMEAVLSITAAELEGSRVIDFSPGGVALGQSLFSLEITGAYEVQLDWNERSGDVAGKWAIGPAVRERFVAHLVFDSDQISRADRLQLYIDGVAAPRGINNTVFRGTTIDLATLNPLFFGLGNRARGARSPRGTLFYAAVYSAALTADEIAQNAAALLASDDSSGDDTPQ